VVGTHDADEQRVEQELEAFAMLTDMVYRNLGRSRRDELAPEEEVRAELLRLLRQDPEAREMLKRIRAVEEARRRRD
jgi:hypothetical protein